MIHVSHEVIDLNVLIKHVSCPEAGAVSTFSGIVRNHNKGKGVLYLEYEGYAPMAEKELQAISEEAQQKWDLHQIAIVHRLGRLEIGESAVAIAISSSHRKDGLNALQFVIDTLKVRIPVWKKEYWEDGSMWLENCCA